MADAPVEIGHVLAGKYRVDRVLGAGGMGVVVAATHLDLDQRVAIKFLLPQALANADVVARFKREAKAAVKIQSEHVARVIDVSTLENGAPYMVMEYLEGGDLAQRIASDGKLAVADAVRYVLEACEALAEAHAAGIVHRDLKPANLFLARRADKTDRVKVLDFGISKSTSPDGAGITSTQAVMGSPYYMSPEQLMSAKHVDARADIWSLGVVLYEELVGSPPYMGETMPEIVAQILQAKAPSVRAQRPDVPEELDRVVATCLSKDPAGRYKDVAALARDLAALTPDGARSVDRISRVLGESVRPPTPSLTDARPSSASEGRGGTVAMSRSTPAAVSQSSAWGATNLGLPRRSNGVLYGVAAAIVVVAGVVVAVALNRGKHEPQPATQSGLVESHTEATADTPPPPPVTATATATTTATATAMATATVAAPAAATPKHHPATKPVASAPPKPSAAPAPTPAKTPHNALDMSLQ